MGLRWLCVLACSLACCQPSHDEHEGRACQSTSDCAALACVAAANPNAGDLEPLELICAEPHDGRPAARSCERGDECASGICALAGTCVEPCAEDSDCAKTERCASVYARGASGRLHPVDACVLVVALPKGALVKIETRAKAFSGDLDAIMLEGSDVPTQYVIEHVDDRSWPVPAPDTTCRPPACALTLAPNDDADALWFDRDALDAADGPINTVSIGDHVYPLSVLVPIGPRAQPTRAGYTLRVESKRRGAARITTLSRAPDSGQLDLNLYYVGAAEFEDAGSELPDTIAGALEEVGRIFEPAGLFVGDVRQVHVTGELLERGADLPDAQASRGFARLAVQYRVYPQLPELFKLSAGAVNPALDVFFVGDIEPLSAADPGAITGATPVPFGMHGTASSGIAIASDMLAGESTQLGRTLAHEIGHALGLFHTTESNGDVFDPLPDTPTCARERDVNRDGLDPSECEGAGADNLMFPTTNASAAELTEDQRAVLRRAMILQ